MCALITKTILAATIAVTSTVTTLAAEEKKGLPHQHLKPDTKVLLEKLKSGGHVMVVRHERTNAFILDQKDFTVDNCSSQRNLSVAGHANAVENGAVLRALQIPVGYVYSSPMCRTLETARLMFGQVEADLSLFGWGAKDPQAIARGFKALIVDSAGQETNTALVTHLGTYDFVLGGHLAEGDTAVFSAEDGEPKFLGVIPANGWNDAIIDASIVARMQGNSGNDDHKGHDAHGDHATHDHN